MIAKLIKKHDDDVICVPNRHLNTLWKITKLC